MVAMICGEDVVSKMEERKRVGKGWGGPYIVDDGHDSTFNRYVTHSH